MNKLHIDIETYSSVDLKNCGVYKYTSSIDFEILLIAFAFDDDPVKIIDVAQGEKIPKEFIEALNDHKVTKYAHNANFERQCFEKIGFSTSIYQWSCTAVKSAYCGLPLSLDMVSKVLNLPSDKAKLAVGKSLIRYFSIPCKPTKINEGRYRNLPHHNIDKWELYKQYCMQDVEAEREIEKILDKYIFPDLEETMYEIDQKINDRGILIDNELVESSLLVNEDYSTVLNNRLKHLTGVENPNSLPQLKGWIREATGKEIESLAKDNISSLLNEIDSEKVKEVLRLRQMLSKSSIKKYNAMIKCMGDDGRGRGFFQFYGANRTGRWAGRLVQLQNLARNYLDNLDDARESVKSKDYTQVELLYGDVSNVLSQLIRTSFIADKNKTLAIADFSSIEARVIAWLANEKWRLDVFNSHGKIYEASAASMFNLPINMITKGSFYRQAGKIAELALGYQGSIGALNSMCESMGLDIETIKTIVNKDIVNRWRSSNVNIVNMWRELEQCAKKAITTKSSIQSMHRDLIFECDENYLTIKLPSGRKLFYKDPRIKEKIVTIPGGNSFKNNVITYKGLGMTNRQWDTLETYGGKITENIVQAIARDILCESMMLMDSEHFDIVMHIHDEIVCEVNIDESKDRLDRMCKIMSTPVSWAPEIPLDADGYITSYYKKD